MKLLQRISTAVLLLALLLATAPAARAFDGRSGDQVVVADGEVIRDDLFAAAGEVIVQGRIEGSLFAAGQRIRIQRTAVISRNLIAAAQSIEIEEGAEIGGDVIVAGQDIQMNGVARGSLIGAGATLLLKGQVSGNTVFGGQEVTMAGRVARDAILGANRLAVSGEVSRNVRAIVERLEIDPAARIGGDLQVRAPQESSIPTGTVAGRVEFIPAAEPVSGAEEPPAPVSPITRLAGWALDQIRRWISLLLIGALMVGLAPGWTFGLVDRLPQRPLARLGGGLLTLILTVGGALIGLILTILIAILLGVLTLNDLVWRVILMGVLGIAGGLFLLSLAWSYLSQVIAGLWAGRWILGMFRIPAAQGRWLPLLLGALLITLLTALPILGFLIALGVALIGLGAIGAWAWERLRSPGEAR
ncbi:polymer-forming cytoskeletal protein [Thermoflexus sp.]|uniref:polymer-forming cytoskeletal protein n=1 Tax=Thermoflexus sp. TaxID=1969742 RepID=UPI002ADE8F2F|nr:polymer-forming cytoskeletal protein [Thermoflexus sp.]